MDRRTTSTTASTVGPYLAATAAAIGGIAVGIALSRYRAERRRRQNGRAVVPGSLTLVLANKNYSSWSLRAWLFVTHAGIDVKQVRIPIFTPQWTDEIKKWSPSERVPVLREDRGNGASLVIWDSLSIFEYLGEKFPEATAFAWPTNSDHRAIAKSMAAEMHSSFLALRDSHPMNIRAEYKGVKFTEGVQADINRIFTMWTQCRRITLGLESVLHGDVTPSSSIAAGPFLFGSFTALDVLFAPEVLRLRTYGAYPTNQLARQYFDTMLALPYIKQWVDGARRETEVIERFEWRADAPCVPLHMMKAAAAATVTATTATGAPQ